MEAGNQGRQIYFTPDIIADASKRQDPTAIAQMEDEVIAHIQELVKKNNEFFAKARGYDNLKNPQQLVNWNLERQNLFNALTGTGPDQRKFVEIYRYENILPPQN